MPLGELTKIEVREIARQAGLSVAEKKDSTGICFIGERPFAEFLHQYLPDDPGVIRDDSGIERGRHRGLAYYTLGQRHGLHIGGAADRPENAWYVAAKDTTRNELIVVQGHEHPLLDARRRSSRPTCIGSARRPRVGARASRCAVTRRFAIANRTRPAPSCARGADSLEAHFDEPQRTPTPGQFIVLYDGDRCLGGATIDAAVAGVDRAPRRGLVRGSRRFPAYNLAVPIESFRGSNDRQFRRPQVARRPFRELSRSTASMPSKAPSIRCPTR